MTFPFTARYCGTAGRAAVPAPKTVLALREP